MDYYVLKDFYGVALSRIDTVLAPSTAFKRPHSHEHWEIFFNIKGTMDIVVDDNTYPVLDGTVRIYAPRRLHYGIIGKEQYMKWYQISLPPSFFENKKFAPLQRRLYEIIDNTKSVFFSDAFLEEVNLIEEIFHCLDSSPPFFEALICANVIKALVLLCNGNVSAISPNIVNGNVKEILSCIEKNYRIINTTKDLSDLCHFSQSYINALFRKHLNTTPHRFIQGKKMNEAKIALSQGMSISQCCESVGFLDYNNFITLFKKTFGITPKKYSDLQ